MKRKPKAPPPRISVEDLAKYPGFRPEIAKEFMKGYNAAIKPELRKWQPPKSKSH